MKRLAQFAAFLVIALLAMQPALAATPCLSGAAAPCQPGCPMSMSSMGADCPMAAAVCLGSCCTVATPQAVANLAPPEPLAIPAGVALVNPLALQAPASLSRAACCAAPFASPPLYLLNQVFRI